MADTTVETKPKRRAGRPKGAKSTATLNRELADVRRQLADLQSRSTTGAAPPQPTDGPAEAPSGPVDDDPFAEPTRDQLAAQEAAAAGQTAPGPVAAPDRVPLGVEKASMLFGVLCQIYNGTSPAVAQRLMAGTLATLPPDQHKPLLEAAAKIAELSDGDMAILGPVIIPRLAQLLVPPSFDLLFALGFVFVAKFAGLMMLRAHPDQAAALLEASTKASEAAAKIIETGAAAVERSGA